MSRHEDDMRHVTKKEKAADRSAVKSAAKSKPSPKKKGK